MAGAALFAAGATLYAATGIAQSPIPSPVDSALLHSFKWRNLGPDRGGRSIAVSGVRGQPKVAYFGATGGGLWKTTNGGEDWAPVTDGQIRSSSIGAVAVSETDPNEVLIGTGECEIRGDIMPGDGMYRSTDAGKTWTHTGFGNADAICKVRIDPKDPRIVFAAVFGKYAVPSRERGVYRSNDGGVTWTQVLFRNDSTGAINVVIDPHNSKVIYAALWQAFRKEYTASSGGAGSGLFKSTDGGTTWTELTRNPGLPSGVDGKIGIAVSPANANRVYALVENVKGGLYRSDDAGATWTLVNESHDIRQRAFYYTHVYADPTDENVVYMQNTSLFKSTDGGKTLTTLRGTHGDFHDLWIDPDNGQHLVVGNDGGGAVSTDGGKKWTDQKFSTAQLYHVAATAGYPYDLCGAQQDASTICVSSTANSTGGGRGGFGRGGSGEAVTYNAGGAEPGYIAPDPLDPAIFFSGSNNGGFLTRLNRRTGEEREVNPYPLMFSGEPSSALVERWQWTYPIIFSPVNPRLLYTSSQHLWKTTNGGQTWTRISPDLTRHDPATMGPSGGPITHDMNAPEVYATIFAIGPSKIDTNVIWTGSDDGLVYVTRDGGAHWTNVTPKGMPDFGRVSQIDASAFDNGTAYVAVKRPLLDDTSPYIFRTHDYGQTWTKIVDGIRADDYVHTVREDPSRKGLLFAGTQHGVYMSYDDGDHWSSLSLNLPDLPVTDLIVYRHDIAISTHGRGFYLLENIVPLEQYSSAVQSAPNAFLFAPQHAIRSTDGAVITYWLKHPASRVSMDVLDASGKVIRAYKSDTSTKATPTRTGGEFGRFGRGSSAPSRTAGLAHFTWDLRYEPATSFPGMILWGGGTQGPSAPPGRYTIRLVVDGQTLSQPIDVKRNPLFTDVSDADLVAQFALGIQIRDKLSVANQAVIDVRHVRSQVDSLLKQNDDPALKQLGDKLNANAREIEENIYQVRNESGQDPLNFPIKINNRIATLLSTVNGGDGPPIGNAPVIFDYLSAKLKVQTDALSKVWATDLAAFNSRAKSLGLKEVTQ